MTIDLLDYLMRLGYSDAEIEETAIRMECGMELPEEVREDIREFYRSFYR